MRPTILHSSHFVNCLAQCLMRGCANPLFITPPIGRPNYPSRRSIAPPIVRPKYLSRHTTYLHTLGDTSTKIHSAYTIQNQYILAALSQFS